MSHFEANLSAVPHVGIPMSSARGSTFNEFRLLSELLLSPAHKGAGAASGVDLPPDLSTTGLEQLEALAARNHVVMRSFEPLHNILREENPIGADWVANAMQRERARIDHALAFLSQICSALEEEGCPVIVIKSLDHLPDLGSDLDLYTDANPVKVVDILKARFKARLADRSWGDRLANKWNFIVPGLPELIEFHAGRLGQTGEQTALTRSLSERVRIIQVNGYVFAVPSPEDAIVISTLQRMYRHFYIRLCDIIDNLCLLDCAQVDFEYLHSLGTETGLWDGIATYLTVISQYAERYRSYGALLSSRVTRAAKFGVAKIYFRDDFLRVPIVPHALALYAAELKSLLGRGEITNSFRLGLLPGLATAAALGHKITGSDKGIW